MKKVKVKVRRKAKPVFLHKTKFYDLFRDGLTQSAISLWLQCREQFRLRYCEGWRKKDLPSYMNFGTVFHNCLEALDTLHLQGKDISKTAITLLSNDFLQKVNFRKSILGKSEKEITEKDDFKAKLIPLLYHYYKFWKRDSLSSFTISRENKKEDIHAEKLPVLEELFDYEFETLYGKVIHLRGRIDKILKDKTGLYWIVDTKTKGTISVEGIVNSLDYDIQLMMYAYCIWRIYGIKVRGVILNIVKRPGLRRKKKETFKEFSNRLALTIGEEREKYYMRFAYRLQEGHLETWFHKFLEPVLHEITRWWYGESSHYINYNALFTRYGPCELYHLLTGRQSIGYTKASVPFPELE